MPIQDNNRGLTLIELVISIAISTIVVLLIISFVNSAFHSFRKVNDNVNLQMEAQTVINQLNNLALQGKRITSINVSSIGEQRFVIETGDKYYTIIFVEANRRLYLVETDTQEQAVITEYIEEQHYFADYVKQFRIIEDNPQKSSVTITLTLSLGTEEYTVTKKVKLRNAT